jgi:RNA polymerase sigma-70 factor (ECF subfamily)
VIDRHRTLKPNVSLEQVADMSDGQPTPEALVETDQESEKLAAVLSRLEPRLRQVILCRFVGGLSHAETAKVMRIAQGHARVLQHRALREMRRLWMEEEA